MTAPTQQPVLDSVTASRAAALAASITRRWRDGESPDAAGVLNQYPDLLRYRTVVVDLAYEEYCLLEKRECTPDAAEFCSRMPAFQSSIMQVVRAHQLLADHPDLLEADPVPWPNPGDKVDGLTLVGELGRGGFARAYAAYDPETDRLCVLKLSPKQGGEGRTIGRLNHPHVTDVYWARRVAGMNAICMPMLGVVTLETVRRAAFTGAYPPESAEAILRVIDAAPMAGDIPPVPVAVVRATESFATGIVAIAARIAGALAYLESQNSSHGDLKPTNVVLGPGGHPYLIDFNLAERQESSVGGTLPYLAPEGLQLLLGASTGRFNRTRADIYSFGVMLFEMLVGRLPWNPVGEGTQAAAGNLLAQRMAAVEIPWPSKLPVPQLIMQLINRCLSPQAAARPTASEVAAVFETWLKSERGENLPRDRRRARLAWLLGSAMLLPVVGYATPGRPSNLRSGDLIDHAPQSPTTAEEFFNRGRVRALQGDPVAALLDFEKSQAIKPDPWTLAYEAYCLAQFNQTAALDRANQALATGANSAQIRNIIGYCYLQTSGKNGLDPAIRSLDEAVRQDGALPAARYNRALARYRAHLDKQFQIDDLLCVQDMDFVLQTPRDSAEVYYNAARIYAAASHRNPELRHRATECLSRALELGDDRNRFLREQVFKLNMVSVPLFDSSRTPVRVPTQPTTPLELRLSPPDRDRR